MLIVKETIIQREVAAIYEHLSKPQNFVGLQPLVVEVDDIRQSTNEAGQVCFDYYAVEQLHFLGFIPYRNKIASRMSLIAVNQHIRQEVRAALGIRLRQDITLTVSGQATHIRNAIDYQAPAMLRAYVHQQIDSAHAYLLEELKRRMET